MFGNEGKSVEIPALFMNENQISLEVKNIEFSWKIASNIELIRKMQNQSLRLIAWMF